MLQIVNEIQYIKYYCYIQFKNDDKYSVAYEKYHFERRSGTSNVTVYNNLFGEK